MQMFLQAMCWIVQLLPTPHGPTTDVYGGRYDWYVFVNLFSVLAEKNPQ